MREKPLVLVLCTGNSARSQMAEAFLRKHQGEHYTVASAGTQPRPAVHPLTVRVMSEIGIDISHQKPKDTREFLGVTPVRHLLIVCDNANSSCPRVWPGSFSRTFMPFDDLTHAVTHVGVAITFGLIVMAMIYTFGDVSGAHMNPAVTLGFWLARRLPGRCVGPYIAAQLLGACAASATLRLMFGNVAWLGATIPRGSPWQSFALETILTGLLMLVILNVSTGPKETGILAGIAIGGVIALEAMFAGPICGASMNPARSIAPALLSGHVRALWVYVIAPISGAMIAVPLWKFVRPADRPHRGG